MYKDLTAQLRLFETVCRHSEKPDIADLVRCAWQAIEELSSAGSIYGKAWTLGYDAGRDENMPRWIPVTEALPKKPKNYPNCKLREYYFLVTLATNAVVCREYDFDNKRWPGTIRVTHWMPLPSAPEPDEPPKEE